ncbi:ABC transporter permease [Actinocrinis puniceicyclus]|uniref:ABC transporter permease n=1 Tax=Actinocrinis puniceicyclus TaxID=977794 RepID=A0A8J7WHR5_9ACTN|nr:ABC transporter permease [Actinocrinis puniceicyclus]MBS2962476.1 ABC transporter permease [Actinocrinis puniceicyclus]
MTGVLALTRLEVLRALRNRRVMFFTILYPTVLFLLSASATKAGQTVDGTNISYRTYYLIAYASFGALGAALTTNAQKIATERKEGWIRQLRLTALPGNGYVLSKIASATLATVPAIIIVFVVGASMGVHLSFAKWVTAFLVLWIGALAFTAMGIAIGYGVPQDSVQMVNILVYVAGSFLGGQFFPLTGALESIGKVLPTYQVRQLATDVISGAHVPSSGVAILLAWTAGAGTLAALMYRRGVDAD